MGRGARQGLDVRAPEPPPRVLHELIRPGVRLALVVVQIFVLLHGSKPGETVDTAAPAFEERSGAVPQYLLGGHTSWKSE